MAGQAVKQAGAVRVERVLVDAKMAAQLLERNIGNRTLSEKTVKRYVADIELGRWMETGDTVKVSTDNTLIDGQHRLTAIVRTGKAQWLLIAYNVSPEARGAIDQGQARKVGQQLQIVQGKERGIQIAARCGIIRAIEAPETLNEKATYYQVCEIYAKHHKGLDWSLETLHGKNWGVAPFAGALAYAYPTNPQAVNEFAVQVRDGENLTKRDPAYALRDLITHTHMSGNGRKLVALATLHCVKAYIEGRPLMVIKPAYLLNPQAEKTQSIVQDALRYFGKIHGFKPE